MRRQIMLVSTAVVAVLCLVVAPSKVLALGLGEARVVSYLNQPLEVRVQLVNTTAEDLDSLTVRPGSPEDYQRVGLDMAARQLVLSTEIDRSVSPPIIVVRSSRAVSDPVLQILLHAQWASGRVLREYTLFLDPPLTDVAPPPARPAPAPRPSESRPAPVPDRPRAERSPPPTESPRPPAAERRPQPASGSYGTVSAGDTLWSIAFNWRPDSSLSMNQVMLAFLEANPHAFAGGNVNQLLRGAELNFPEIGDVRAVDVRRAEQEIQAQMQAWQSGTSALPVISDAGLPAARPQPAPRPEPAPESPASAEPAAVPREDSEATEAAPASESRPTEPAQPDVVHRLELVPPEEDVEAAGATEGELDSEAEVRRLRAALARAEEDLFTYQLESEDLAHQVNALREALEARDRGVTITDSELADLEVALREARLAAAEEAALAGPGDDPVAAYFQSLEETLGGVPQPDEEAETFTGDEAEDEDAATGVGATAEPAPPAGLEREMRGLGWWLRQPWVMGVAGLLAVLIVLGVLLGMRRRGEQPARGKPAMAPPAPRETDPLRLQRDAVKADPRNLAMHLALLKLLAVRDDKHAFAAALDDMYAHVPDDDDPAWQEARELAMNTVPDHPLVAVERDQAVIIPESGPEETAEADGEDDLLRILADDEDDDPLPVDAPPPVAADEGEGLAYDSDDLETFMAEVRRQRDAELDGDDLPLDDDMLVGEDAQEGLAAGSGHLESGDISTASEEPLLEADEPVVEADVFAAGADDAPAVTEAAEAEAADSSDVFSLGEDEAEVKLDLAQAYLSMGDRDAARTILNEVVSDGSPAQRDKAQKMLNAL